MYMLESNRKDHSQGGKLLSRTEKRYFDMACKEKLLGVPLILWDKRCGLRPSPFKRIYKIFCTLMPSHSLRVASAKAMYRARRQKGGVGHKKKQHARALQTSKVLVTRLRKRAKRLQSKLKTEKRRIRIDWTPNATSDETTTDERTGDEDDGTTTTTSPATVEQPSAAQIETKSKDSDKTTLIPPPRAISSLEAQLDRLRIQIQRSSSSSPKSPKKKRTSMLLDTSSSSMTTSPKRMNRTATRPLTGGPNSIDDSMQAKALYDKLFAISQRHATRNVQSVRYGSSSVLMPIDLIVSYTLSITHLDTASFEIFEPYFTCDATKTLLESLFWLLFLRYFQKPNNDRSTGTTTSPTTRDEHGSHRNMEQALIQRICEAYVVMLNTSFREDTACRLNESTSRPEDVSVMSRDKDVLFRIYPFVISKALIELFWFLFPASRHRVGGVDFKQAVLRVVCRTFYGMNLVSTTLKTHFNAIFPTHAISTSSSDGNEGQLGQGRSSLSGKVPRRGKVKSEYELVDEDQDGMLTRAEWIKMFGHDRGFDALDKDNDGHVDVSEFNGLMGFDSSRRTSSLERSVTSTQDSSATSDAADHTTKREVGTTAKRNKKKRVAVPRPRGVKRPTSDALRKDAMYTERPRIVKNATTYRPRREVFPTHRTTALVQRYLSMPYQNAPDGVCRSSLATRSVPDPNDKSTKRKKRIYVEASHEGHQRNADEIVSTFRDERDQLTDQIRECKVRYLRVDEEVRKTKTAVLKLGNARPMFLRRFAMAKLNVDEEPSKANKESTKRKVYVPGKKKKKKTSDSHELLGNLAAAAMRVNRVVRTHHFGQ